ncbi:SMP-30/gluconolactonase/LRE family protein [Myxococcota bacterium]|nr:SMP-30/gluconolactonase/LRE family protein [Myxococcota bacterium]
MRRLWPSGLLTLLIGAFGVGYLSAWPIDVDPAPMDLPPPPAFEGDFARNDRLSSIRRLADGLLHGPEDVLLDAEGRLLTGLLDGRVARLRPGEALVETIVNTGGRPLGLAFAADGALWIADAQRGLLRHHEGQLTVMSEGEGGRPFRFVDELAIAPDGVVYFTDASSRYGPERYRDDFMEHRPNGRLLSFNPATGETRLVLGGLYFPNGVVVSADGGALYVAESGMARILRVPLGVDTPKATPLIENLPGYPDNLSLSAEGVIWAALFAPRHAQAEAIMRDPAWTRALLRLPPALRPAPERLGMALGIAPSGEILHNLQDPAGRYAPVTSVVEEDGQLYIGSLSERAVGVLPAPR